MKGKKNQKKETIGKQNDFIKKQKIITIDKDLHVFYILF